MIIQAELRRKQSEYEGEACVVDKVIELPAQRFQQFSRALLMDVPAKPSRIFRHRDRSHGGIAFGWTDYDSRSSIL